MAGTFNVYCDESSHLVHDLSSSMVLGCVWCEAPVVFETSVLLRNLKQEHGLKRNYEAKWTKVSAGQLKYYNQLIDCFFSHPNLRFRAVLIPDKSALRHRDFGQSYDEWYYKMYFVLLKYLPLHSPPESSFAMYLDMKDTHTPQRARLLHEILCNSLHDFGRSRILRVQPVRSHEVELLQVADVLIGAIAARSRGETTSKAKLSLMARIEKAVGGGITTTTPDTDKFNLLRWRPQAR